MTGARLTRAVEVPLVVDLDGTLIRCDLLIRGFFKLLTTRPTRAGLALLALGRGKAFLKAAVADEIVLDLDKLPFDPVVLEYLRRERAARRPLYIASAADSRHVEQIASHLNLFDGAFGTSAGINLSGAAKAARLLQTFGPRGFDYIGNDTVDLKVWDVCRRPIAANVSPRLRARLRRRYSNLLELVDASVGGPVMTGAG